LTIAAALLSLNVDSDYGNGHHLQAIVFRVVLCRGGYYMILGEEIEMKMKCKLYHKYHSQYCWK